jgi:hypothetical protein
VEDGSASLSTYDSVSVSSEAPDAGDAAEAAGDLVGAIGGLGGGNGESDAEGDDDDGLQALVNAQVAAGDEDDEEAGIGDATAVDEAAEVEDDSASGPEQDEESEETQAQGEDTSDAGGAASAVDDAASAQGVDAADAVAEGHAAALLPAPSAAEGNADVDDTPLSGDAVADAASEVEPHEEDEEREGRRNKPPPRAARSPADARAQRLLAYLLWGAVAAIGREGEEELCTQALAACGGVSVLAGAEEDPGEHTSGGQLGAAAELCGQHSHISAGAVPASLPALCVASQLPDAGALAALLSQRRRALFACAQNVLRSVMADSRVARAPCVGAQSPAFVFAAAPATIVPIADVLLCASASDTVPPLSSLPLAKGATGSGSSGAGDACTGLASAGADVAVGPAGGDAAQAVSEQQQQLQLAAGMEGQLVGLCSRGLRLLQAAAAPSSTADTDTFSSRGRSPAAARSSDAECVPLRAGQLPCLGLGYVRRFDPLARELHIVTPLSAAALEGGWAQLPAPSYVASGTRASGAPGSPVPGSSGAAAVPASAAVCTGVDVLVCWRGSNDVPAQLLYRASPHGDDFACPATDLTSVRTTALAGGGGGRKNLKRRRIGE